jgi:hypothetical protein
VEMDKNNIKVFLQEKQNTPYQANHKKNDFDFAQNDNFIFPEGFQMDRSS